MLGWSINLFRIRGIQLAVHLSFFLLLAYVAHDGWVQAGALGLVWSTAMLVAFFACVVLHELGHSFTAMHFGIGVRRILLMPIGGMAQFDEIPRQPARELLITLAGPAVNFVIAAVLWILIKLTLTPESLENLYSADGLLWQLFLANLVMGLFNLVPVFPMDGGRILRALLATRLPYLRATFWAATVAKVLAGTFIVTALYLDWNHSPVGNYVGLKMLAVLFAFIFFVGDAEYRAAKRRELEDARWREVLAHTYRELPPPVDEPPVLLR